MSRSDGGVITHTYIKKVNSAMSTNNGEMPNENPNPIQNQNPNSSGPAQNNNPPGNLPAPSNQNQNQNRPAQKRPAPPKPSPNQSAIHKNPGPNAKPAVGSPAEHTRTFDTNQTAKITKRIRAEAEAENEKNSGAKRNPDGTYNLTGRNIKSNRQRLAEKQKPVGSDDSDGLEMEIPVADDRNRRKRKDASAAAKEEKQGGFYISGILKVVIYIVGVILTSVVLSYYIITVANDVYAFVKDEAEVSIVIPENADINKIAKILGDKKLINYPMVFDIYMTFKQNKNKDKENYLPWEFEPGIYTVSAAMNYDEFISMFRKKAAAREVVRVTIPEGYTTDQILVTFLNNGLGTLEGFLKVLDEVDFSKLGYAFLEPLYEEKATYKENPAKLSEKRRYAIENRKYILEGYLFPDTYDFYTDENETNIIMRLLSNFNEKLSLEYTNKAKNLNMPIDDLINLAGIIEREGYFKEDLPKIAAVFHNRLINSSGFPNLESDATILYSYGKIVYCDTKQWHFDGGTIDCTDCLANKYALDDDGRISHDPDGRPIVIGCGARNIYSYRYIRPDMTVYDTKTDALTQAELLANLPYNSYSARADKNGNPVTGLLPSAVCNPGIESIYAAFWPEEEFPYYFFVTDDDGHAHFAKTKAEHDKNIEQIRNERAAATAAGAGE